jgi:hypothetical protein
MSGPFVGRGGSMVYSSPPIPGGKSKVCGLCATPKSDRIHIEGELEADAESPKWG